jgi:hypothetical protein
MSVKNEGTDMTELNSSKRKFLKAAAYVAPAILTLKAIPSFASSGSGRGDQGNNGVGNGYDPQPTGNPPINDNGGTSLGNPGNSSGVSYQSQSGNIKKKKRRWYWPFS